MCNDVLYFLSCRFHHPKAENIGNPHSEIAIKEPHKGIQLQDIKCKLTFVSNPKEMKNLLLVCPPMISMCNTAEGQSKQLAVATITIDPLLEEEMVSNCHYFLMSVEFFALHNFCKRIFNLS